VDLFCPVLIHQNILYVSICDAIGFLKGENVIKMCDVGRELKRAVGREISERKAFVSAPLISTKNNSRTS